MTTQIPTHRGRGRPASTEEQKIERDLLIKQKKEEQRKAREAEGIKPGRPKIELTPEEIKERREHKMLNIDRNSKKRILSLLNK